MTQDQIIQSIADKIEASIPDELHSIGRDFKQNLKALIKETLSQWNIVMHDEFDIQSNVLARAQKKIALLEERVAALEAALEPSNRTNKPTE